MYAAEHAKIHPDKPAIVMATSGEVVTFGEYEAGANRVAHLLRDAGLRRRDHVAIFMDNDPRMLMCEGGAERTGLYYTCVNSYLSAEEVAYIVNDSRGAGGDDHRRQVRGGVQAAGAVPERRAVADGRGGERPGRAV